MKFATRKIVAAGLLAAFGLAAQAQTPPAAPQGTAPTAMMGHRHGGQDGARMHERMERRMAERQAYLKEKLQLTPAQEGAWAAWTQSVKPAHRGEKGQHRGQRAEFAKLTTPERIDRMRAMRAQRLAEMDKRADATKAFYAQLTPQQQKVFDDEGARFGRGGRHGRHHG
jgi:Spy/CpxP family protein refolding chaperone